MPLISVIVPVYKVEAYLHRCVDSILSQTFTDFELILVDDGSPDNCGTICDEYALKDNRIRVIHQENGGLSAARNAGIDWAFENSDSQWLAFVDSDDWVHAHYLDYLLRAATETGTMISACGVLSVENEMTMPETAYCVETKRWDDFYFEDWTIGVVAWNKLYRKDLFRNMRYPVGRIHEDEFLTYRLLAQSDAVSFVNSSLYFYFQNPKGIMRSVGSPINDDAVIALEKQCEYAKANGYEKFYKNAIKRYVYVLHNQLNVIDSRDKTAGQTDRKRIQKKLQKVLLANREIVPFSENTWHYEAAFPKLMNIYWVMCAQLKKLKRQSK